ncbi:VOC family protein [Acanthopleuribacter pedis]|uniref:VOC family protein n=1 Tax=Acanthopleuribacter pedis TaxID=442870 RepID=A0A8J7U5C1_9BACT|nr:VOC family protein [Acanthopleuribacter pedis]MBO1320699.1 VOC family protein [Acanthopleuribacter pedis]
MQNQLMPYLIFPGTCRRALEFYNECTGGEVAFLQTFAESPLQIDEDHSELVFNAEFHIGPARFRASDNLPPHKLNQGDNFSLFLTFPDQERQKATYTKLAEGGQVIMPLEGPFGMLRDKFGIQWMLVFSPE